MRLPVVTLALCLLPLLAGCPTSGDDDDAPPDVHAWYEGTSQATKPDGEPLGDASEVVLRRSVLPTVDHIEEQLVERAPGEDALEVIATLTVVPEDSTFRVSYQDIYGLLEGEGLLSGGADWQWTTWESSVVYQTGERLGTTIHTTAELSDGVLVQDTEIVDGDGDLTVLSHTELQGITEQVWQARYAEIVGG